MTATPRPLPPHSPRLRSRRYQFEVLTEFAPGRWKVAHTGRFANYDDGRVWADTEHADAERVMVTFYSASDGWQSHASGRRFAGRWEPSGPLAITCRDCDGTYLTMYDASGHETATGHRTQGWGRS